MNIPTPKHAGQAAHLARINERACNLFRDGYRASYLADDHIILVTNDEGTTYQVDAIFETCNCPYYEESQFCKHVIGATRLLDLTAAEQNEKAEADEHEMSVELYRQYQAKDDPFANA